MKEKILYHRICPKCHKELVYGTKLGCNVAEKKNSLCHSCTNNERYKGCHVEKSSKPKKQKPDHCIKPIKDYQGKWMGCFMKMEGCDNIIGLNNKGTFVSLFDGENTYTLPDKQFFCGGNATAELIFKNYVDNSQISGSVPNNDNPT